MCAWGAGVSPEGGEDLVDVQAGRQRLAGEVEDGQAGFQADVQLRTRRICPTCDGVGRIISPELLSLNLVRRIEGRAALGRLARAKVVLHSKVADYVQNNRRRELADLEGTYRIVVEIVGDPGVELSTERRARLGGSQRAGPPHGRR